MAWPYAFFLVWTPITTAVATVLWMSRPRRRSTPATPQLPRRRDPRTQQGWGPARTPRRAFESWDHAETVPQQPAAAA